MEIKEATTTISTLNAVFAIKKKQRNDFEGTTASTMYKLVGEDLARSGR
jgi:hypothetical protein